ncbi:MAG TPA: hypothetical protein VF487_07825 [Chitinophagaceae bacterium]
MPKPTIEGKWIGHFVYGETYPKEFKSKKISFVIEIAKDNELIKGTCIDDLSREIFKNPAIIEGLFENDFITFIKRYPALLTEDENNNLVAHFDKPSVNIHYKGVLTKNLFSRIYFFKGEWEISGSYLDEMGQANYYTFAGKWRMQKSE